MKTLGNSLSSFARKALVTLEVHQHSIRRAVTPTRGTRALYAAVYGVSFALFMVVPCAHAQQTLGDSMNTAGQTVDAGKALAGKVGLGAGAVFGVSAGGKMYQKSKEGENSQVKATTILGLFLAAVCSAGAGALLLRAGASIGLQSSDYGTVPGG